MAQTKTPIIMSTNPEACFERAIANGTLSLDRAAPNGVYYYMYMHSTREADHFKCIATRRHVASPRIDK